MDSLLATYASSDEDEDQQQPIKQNQTNQSNIPSQPASKFGGNFFSSLPPPKSQPSQTPTTTNTSSSKPKKSNASSSASLFSKLPQPKSDKADLDPKPKKIVQFRPPVMAKVVDDDDDEDDDKEVERNKDDFLPQPPSVKSFLSSIPAPRNSGSLGALSSSAGMGRRSILEADVPGLSNSSVLKGTVNKASDNQVKYDNDFVTTDINSSGERYVNEDNTYNGYATADANVVSNSDYATNDYTNYDGYQNVATDHSSYGPSAPASDDHSSYGPAPPASIDQAGYSSYDGYNDYANYGQYESKWIDRSSADLGPEISVASTIQSVSRVPGKRGRNEIPQEIIEVSQDELMKNRPREDQVKATGIAFGPSYQPTSSSTKGKPTKLHKRKHQIGSLYFDMRSKEMELAERRSKGFLTKAETQAKYGW